VNADFGAFCIFKVLFANDTEARHVTAASKKSDALYWQGRRENFGGYLRNRAARLTSD